MKRSESLFFDLRRLRYHVRHWVGDPARRMVLLHGFLKKTQKTPREDFELARRNKSKHERGLQ